MQKIIITFLANLAADVAAWLICRVIEDRWWSRHTDKGAPVSAGAP